VVLGACLLCRQNRNAAQIGGRLHHVVNQILGRSPCSPPTSATSYTDCGDKGGGLTFNAVTAPADATYDVTFWYHSGGEGGGGQADTYGDTHCGGLDYDTGAGSGCRPHLTFVNGVQLMATVGGQNAVYYQFPALPRFPGPSFTALSSPCRSRQARIRFTSRLRGS
jgi:hypothetical protein